MDNGFSPGALSFYSFLWASKEKNMNNNIVLNNNKM